MIDTTSLIQFKLWGLVNREVVLIIKNIITATLKKYTIWFAGLLQRSRIAEQQLRLTDSLIRYLNLFVDIYYLNMDVVPSEATLIQ
jgi:hypothetical protein